MLIVKYRLRIVKKAKEVSQKQLGILAGIDEFSASPRINQYERGKHVSNFATAQRLAEVLSIPVAYLYASDDDLSGLVRSDSLLSWDGLKIFS